MKTLTRLLLLLLWLTTTGACEDPPSRQPIGYGFDPIDLGFEDGGPTDELQLACQPGYRQCLGESSPLYEVCDASGAFFIPGSCDEGEICRDRRCVPFACQIGRDICLSGEVAARCADDGKSFTDRRTCAENEACRGGTCINLCANAEAQGDYVGCEYLTTRLPNQSRTNHYDWAIVVGNPNRFLPSKVSVVSPNDISPEQLGFDPVASVLISPANVTSPIEDIQDVQVPPGHMAVFVLDPPDLEPLLLQATRPVVATQFNPYCCNTNYTNDASLLFPTYTAQERYRLTGFPRFDVLNSEVFAVTGPTPTTISWTEGGDAQVRSVPPWTSMNITSIQGDIAGSELNANAPVTVFASHYCTFIPIDLWACDHLESQIPPASTLGNRYLLTPTRIRSENLDETQEATFWRVSADEDVTFSLEPDLSASDVRPPSSPIARSCLDFLDGGLVTLQTGQTCEFGATKSRYLKASGRVIVSGFISGHQSTGSRSYGRAAGDPSLFILPPMTRLRTQYSFISPPTYEVNYITIGARTGAPILFDGVLIDESQKLQRQPVDVDGQAWTVFTLRIGPGVHTMSSATPFSLLVYAYDDYVSYAYVGGLDLGSKE